MPGQVQRPERILESVALHNQDTRIQQLGAFAEIYNISSPRRKAAINYPPPEKPLHFFPDL